MDCCNYGEYRGQAHAAYGAGAAAGWEGYGYAPLPYAPYAHAYYSPHAHDPYMRYYRYDYPAHHVHHNDHAMPMDYGVYALKEARTRRALARRELRAHPSAHLPLPHTPPLECGLNGRSSAYCEQQMWPSYQMGMLGSGGWNGTSAVNGSWASRTTCSREPIRYASDCRLMKSSNLQPQTLACAQDGRSTPYPTYEESHYDGDNGVKQSNMQEYSGRTITLSEAARPVREHFVPERRSPPEEKRPPVVPLPAFQQAFGSTEIGKFAEAFSRAEVAHETEDSSQNFMYEPFQEWDGPPELQWTSPPATREIKCEDNF